MKQSGKKGQDVVKGNSVSSMSWAGVTREGKSLCFTVYRPGSTVESICTSFSTKVPGKCHTQARVQMVTVIRLSRHIILVIFTDHNNSHFFLHALGQILLYFWALLSVTFKTALANSLPSIFGKALRGAANEDKWRKRNLTPEYEILLISSCYQSADWYYLDVDGVINDRKQCSRIWVVQNALQEIHLSSCLSLLMCAIFVVPLPDVVTTFSRNFLRFIVLFILLMLFREFSLFILLRLIISQLFFCSPRMHLFSRPQGTFQPVKHSWQ